jgi:glycyl-tRNA synthetase
MVVDRIDLAKDEAADVDIIDDDNGDLLVAFCTPDDVLVYRIKRGSDSSTTNNMPYYVHTIPPNDVFSDAKRPSFRSLRFLTPNRILLLQNLPDRTGASLLVLCLNDTALGTITFQKRLHKSIKSAVALTTSILSTSPTGEKQIAIAVAGSNIAIEVLTLNFSPITGLSKFFQHTLLRNVHPLQMTALTFSTYFPPPMPITATTPPQYLKLASVSMGNTVAVHTFPLRPYPAGKNRTPRYVLAVPGAGWADKAATYFTIFFALFIVTFGSFFIQAFLEIRGGNTPDLGAARLLPDGLRVALQHPMQRTLIPNFPTDIPVAQTAQRLTDLLPNAKEEEKQIIIRDDGKEISAEFHHDEEKLKEEGKRWEELSEKEKSAWRRKLVDAGHWAVEEGETVLKGVFFGELAGLVGGALGG